VSRDHCAHCASNCTPICEGCNSGGAQSLKRKVMTCRVYSVQLWNVASEGGCTAVQSGEMYQFRHEMYNAKLLHSKYRLMKGSWVKVHGMQSPMARALPCMAALTKQGRQQIPAVDQPFDKPCACQPSPGKHALHVVPHTVISHIIPLAIVHCMQSHKQPSTTHYNDTQHAKA